MARVILASTLKTGWAIIPVGAVRTLVADTIDVLRTLERGMISLGDCTYLFATVTDSKMADVSAGGAKSGGHVVKAGIFRSR